MAFFATEPGETRFVPTDLIVSNVGVDFRPIDVIGLSPGFGENRLRQRETQGALFAFDVRLDVNQPLVVRYEGASTDAWAETLQRVERERALIRSRSTDGTRRP